MKDTEILKQKNNMKFLFKLLFTVSILYSAEAYSWGIIGHRTIAEIAENHISNKSKRKLKKIIGKQNLAYIANWPDFVKSDTCFSKVTQSIPTFATAYFWRGKANVQQDPKNEKWLAKPHYEKALVLSGIIGNSIKFE